MSGSRRNYHTSYEKRERRNGRYREEYIQGTAVRKIAVQEPQRKVPPKHTSNEVRKNRDKARHMSAGYVIFLAAALCAAAFILVNYIQLQSDLTTLTGSVAEKESQLNALKLSNDEEYSRIVSSIDLEEIKRVAIGELGMVYVQEGQIVKYNYENGDYMRQVTDGN